MPDPSPDDGASVDAVDATLEIVDRRTRRSFQIPIDRGAIRATDLARIRRERSDDHGLASYDPALVNTAACISAITYIDGDRGILRYRGYPIEQLAGNVRYLDVAYLLIHGELPDELGAAAWSADVAAGADLPPAIERLVETFPPDAHPMGVLQAAWSALGTYRDGARSVDDAAARTLEIPRFLGAIGALVGLVFRHRTGRPLAAPTGAQTDHAARLYRDLFPEAGEPDPVLIDALDTLLIMQADHEQNCSTNAVRAVGSSRVDPYSAISAGIAALYGPLHGGANEAVVRMLHDIETVDRVPAYIDSVKHGERRLMGFGHRVYKSYDPRAKIIKATMRQVFEVTGMNPLLDVALAIETTALEDDYFVGRRLYPNVDFYSGLIYEAMGLPIDTYTTIFAVARMAGWVAHWVEGIGDTEQKITRPRQIYVGPDVRDLVR
jgi:citrate synthase